MSGWEYPGKERPFLAVFTKEKKWKTLDTAPTIIITEVSGSTRLVDGLNMAEHPAMPGLYLFPFTFPVTNYQNYIGKCSCTDTDTDYQDTPSFWPTGDNIIPGLEVILGAWLVTIQLYENGTTTPIDAGLVTIVDSTGYPIAWGGVTGNAGQTAHQLDNGSYTLRIRKTGYSFIDIPFVVADSNLTVTAYGVSTGSAAESETLRAISGNIGPWKTTIQLYIEGGTTPIDAGLLELVGSDGHPIAWQGVTGPDGTTEVNLADGTYTLKSRKVWFSFENVAITVSGAAQTVTAYGVIIPFPSGGVDVIGNRKISIQVYDDGTTNPIQDALISLVTDAVQPVAWSGITNTDGQTVAYQGDGGYSIRTRKAGYTFDAVSITLSGSDISTVVYGVPYVIIPPADPGAVAIEEFLNIDNFGNFPETVTANLEIIDRPPDFSGRLLSTKKIIPTYNPITGVIRWEIPVGVTIKVNIPDHAIRNRKCVVPDVITVRLLDIPEI